MYIDELITVFEQTVSDYPDLQNSEVLELLRDGIVAKKYDLQDQGLIEAILREDKKELADSLREGLRNEAGDVESDDIKKEAINIFIASLEHLINYYYNNVIGKHFSST